MGMAAEPEFHVLAVDDSLIDRKLIERLLKKASFQVTTVDSGYKALEFLGLVEDEQPSVSPDSQKEVEVNLIITDYCMPGMTGYDLLKKVKESSAFRHIPVVFMSSENVPSIITRCLEEGADEFFLKPVRLSDVNRLRPHMLRAKYGQRKQDLLQEFQKLDPKSEQQQQQRQQQQQLQQTEQQQQLELQQTEQQPQQQQELQQIEQQPQPQQQEELQQTEQQQQQQQQQQSSNNKRKSMDEGLPTDRTRPIYNDITTVV